LPLGPVAIASRAILKYWSRILRCDFNFQSQQFLITYVKSRFLIWMLFHLYGFRYYTLWHWQGKQPYFCWTAICACIMSIHTKYPSMNLYSF
jgi:hypothetical protein